MRPLLTVCAAALLFAGAAPPKPDITPLTLVKALPVEGPENAQPSGLTILNGDLLTVSDKHDDTIFRIELEPDKAVLKPHVTFQASKPDGLARLDFEGITCDDKGNFYLVSETAFAILRVSADGREVSWLTESLRSHGEKKGLFQAPGGGLEGIACMGAGRFLVCAERQARGLIEVNTQITPPEIKVTNLDSTAMTLPEGRSPSFSDLFREGGDVYAIERSAGAITRLALEPTVGARREAWSYEHIVNRDDLRYSDMRFGTGEGLAIDKDRMFLILDNNGDYRQADPEDRRPLLLIMERPPRQAAGGG